MDDPDARPFAARVALPFGAGQVAVDRRGLGLSARGGFDARWAPEGPEPIDLEDFRLRVRAHLAALYRRGSGTEAPSAMLNLASHQLVDDLRGWARLNQDALRPNP